MQPQEQRMHTLMARGIVAAYQRNIEQYDLEGAIADMLGYIRRDERLFWQETLRGAVEMCEQQDKREAAAVLQILLEGSKQV